MSSAAAPTALVGLGHFRKLFEEAPVAYLVTDAVGRITDANRASDALLRLGRGAVMGLDIVSLVAEKDVVRQLVRRAPVGARAVRVAELHVGRRPGERRLVALHCCALEHEEPRRRIGWVMHDLQGRVRRERVRERSHARQTQQLRQEAEELRAVEEAKSSFLNLASHELRSPLTVISGYVSMLIDGSLGPVPEPVARVLEVLNGKTLEMNRLVQDMLDTARLHSLEDPPVSRRPVDLCDIVEAVVRDWRPLLGDGHRLHAVVPDAPVLVAADPTHMRSIVVNLVQNAVKYSPGGGDVFCTVAGDDGATVVVADAGIGIAQEHLAILFTRFGRIVTPETSSIHGTGLGLYIVRELTRAHGGDVTVTSQPGEGSCFTVRLPLLAR